MDLASRIGSCLPPQKGRTVESSRAAAMAIARGLLEFTVADIDPKLFQQVLLTRLQRMEAGQASALDDALLGFHADLIARLDAQGEVDARLFASVMEHLKRVLERLPPDRAQRGQIAVYLRTLIDWLNTRPVAAGPPVRRPVLTPAAIERKLRIASASTAPAGPRAAPRCRRSGTAMRATGRAGRSRARERPGWPSALPGAAPRKPWTLLPTAGVLMRSNCRSTPPARACSAPTATSAQRRCLARWTSSVTWAARGSARPSACSSLNGTSRLVLVIDSLDEAHGSAERLRQAGTLPWRIILTSRPSSWNHQLAIDEKSDSHRVGELQPLRYPDDVEPFIQRWFAQKPERGDRSCRPDRAARRPAAGRHRAADPCLLLHRRRQRAPARLQARPVCQGAQPHAHRPLAR